MSIQFSYSVVKALIWDVQGIFISHRRGTCSKPSRERVFQGKLLAGNESKCRTEGLVGGNQVNG